MAQKWIQTNGAPISGFIVPQTNAAKAASKVNAPLDFQPKDNMGALVGAAKPIAAVPTPTPTAASSTTSYVPTPVSSGGGAYASAIDAQLEANLIPLRAQMEQNQREYDLAKQRLETNRDEAMRQAYIEAQMQKRNLPQQLARTGYNGGLTESTMAGLSNTYMNNRNALELQYADDLADLDLEKYKMDSDVNAMIAQAKAEAEASRLASRASSGSSGISGSQKTVLKAVAKNAIDNSTQAARQLAERFAAENMVRAGKSDNEILQYLNSLSK